jgi:hypothetical protein
MRKMKTKMEDGGWKMDAINAKRVGMRRAILHLPSSILVFALLVLVHPALADDGWSLTTSDFKRQNVNLRSFD